MHLVRKYIWVLMPLLLVSYFSYLARSFQMDDALIYMRYIENFHDGLGLVYNPGEKFNGLTSPFFTFVVLIAGWFYADLQAVMVVLSALFLFLAAIFAALTFSDGLLERLVIASGVACVSYFYYTFGMETPLFLMLIALSLYLYKVDSPWFLVVLALLITTRSEGIFLAVPMGLDFLVRKRQLPEMRFFLGGALIFISPYIFNYFYYGEFLAATGGAKIGQGTSGLWGEGILFLNAFYLKDLVFSGSGFAALFFVIASIVGAVISLLRIPKIAGLALVFGVLLLAFYVGLNIPDYHWYYGPFMFFMVIFSVKCAWFLGAKLHGWFDSQACKVISVWVVILAFIVPASNLVSMEEKGRNESYAQIGMWLKENTPADASVAMVEIGTVGWYADRTVIDILGLVNEHNADYIGERNFYGWLTHYAPNYILRHEPIWPHEQSVTFLEEVQAYLPAPGFSLPGYVMLVRHEELLPEYIHDLAHNRIAKLSALKLLASSSELGAPFVQMEDELLFAHAPSTVSTVLDRPSSLISVEFGLRQGAEGKHSGVCFEVVRGQEHVLMRECIYPDARGEELSLRREIEFDGAAGERISFRASCIDACNYAWSYWSEVLVR